jgi:nicotinamidase-related amidase
MSAKPWEGVIPAEDAASFAAGYQDAERELDAGERPALLIVDMTREMAYPEYSIGWPGEGAIEANAALLAEARAIGIPIYFTKDFEDPDHRPTAAERGRWKYRRAERDPDLPSGDVIVDELAPLEGETLIHKGARPSPFFGTNLASLLTYEGVDTVVITGMVTSGCVRAAVLDAFQHNYRVVVPHEACADRSQLSHAVSMFDMHMKYCDVVSLEEALDYLRTIKPRAAATPR